MTTIPTVDDALSRLHFIDTFGESSFAFGTIPGSEARRWPTLLVDDHPLVREGLRARLEVVPHLSVVGEAADGEAALALVERVMLRDIDHPGARERHRRWRAQPS